MKYSLPLFVLAYLAVGAANPAWTAEFQEAIQPLLTKYCVECHSGKDPEGEVEFAAIRTEKQIDLEFKTWQRTASRLIDRDMPPEGELQPTELERSRILDWYQQRFVDSIEARPGRYLPRRLSAAEYRSTLRSLFGFDLEVAIIEAEQTHTETSLVMKLLPEDPPGRSGFQNDTHGNPLTTVIWSQYSYLVDHALEQFFDPANPEHLESYVGAIDQQLTESQAETLIRTFVPKAHRRPLPEAELTGIVNNVIHHDENDDLVAASKRELKAVLMSPSFLYRGLLMKRQPGQYPVDDFELAERVSYFLWGDMPDEILVSLAADGSLSDPNVLSQQVTRMLESPKSRNLAEDFAFQWLALGEIEQATNNYPLRQSLTAQATDFMNYLFTEDRPLMELIDSQVTFVNPLIAKFYSKDRHQLTAYRKARGIEVEFVPPQKINLEQTEGRGGILTMPGIVAMNKGPVIRGTWMLTRILGDHLPDPPMDVGSVAANRKGEKLTFRQRFERHRSDPSCASCHDRIDPLGFALQRYSATGALLTGADLDGSNKRKKKGRKKKGQAEVDQNVDTAGKLPSGETFEDMDGLKQLLTTSKRQSIIRNIVRRTLSYAMCRPLEIHDNPTVDRISAELDKNNGSYRDLFQLIVQSLPFRETIMPAE